VATTMTTDNDVANTSVSLFPNPTNSYIVMKVIAAKGGSGIARITDGTGKLVATKNATLSAGLNLVKFDDLKGLKSGTYHVQLNFNYHIYNQQLVVVK
ncbi:MAG: hypothetical protein JWQ09_3989, partial [Segetibacter sp.]|nr:hypothetical protein [Segetibacter sp.]